MAFPRRPLRCLLLAAVLLFAQSNAYAQFSYGNADSYRLGLPGGYYGGQSGSASMLDVGFRAGGGLDFLGCAGVGLFDFMQTTFNVGNIIDQLKGNMQTMLAKTLLTTAMSVPQVSAIFDSLNAFGNAKFDMFQQSCNMNTVRKEAKDMFISRCTRAGNSVGECNDSWDGGSTSLAGDSKNEIMSKLKGLICQRENTTETARGFACPEGGACPVMAFIPQMRINLGGPNMDCNSGQYGTRDSIMTFDGMQKAVTYSVASPVLDQANGVLTNIRQRTTQSQRDLATRATMARCRAGECGQGSGGQGGGGNVVGSRQQPFFLASQPLATVSFGQAEEGGEEADMVGEFKKYISCPEPDNVKGFQLFNEYISQVSAYAGSVGEGFTPANIDRYFSDDKLDAVGASLRQIYQNDIRSLTEIINIAAKCKMDSIAPLDLTMINALEKAPNGASMIEALMMSAANEWGFVVAQSVAQFTINKSHMIAAQMASSAAPRPESIANEMDGAGATSSTGTMEENPGAEESSKTFDEAVKNLKEELANMERTYEQTRKSAITKGELLGRISSRP